MTDELDAAIARYVRMSDDEVDAEDRARMARAAALEHGLPAELADAVVDYEPELETRLAAIRRAVAERTGDVRVPRRPGERLRVVVLVAEAVVWLAVLYAVADSIW
jgi:hypothetical protein